MGSSFRRASTRQAIPWAGWMRLSVMVVMGRQAASFTGIQLQVITTAASGSPWCPAALRAPPLCDRCCQAWADLIVLHRSLDGEVCKPVLIMSMMICRGVMAVMWPTEPHATLLE